MLITVVSPAKKLDFESELSIAEQTKPIFLPKTNTLARELKNLNANDVGKLMKLSANLSELNFERFQSFKNIYNPSTSKQAMYAFNGDTYTGLDANTLNPKEIKVAQKKLRILSGLYGILKPLDLIQPYRLEMGTKFKFSTYKDLYQYWGSDIADSINEELKAGELINCASNEYFKAVDLKSLKATVITPVFKEMRNGELKIISFSAKRARGMMARYIIQNNISKAEDIKNFAEDNYKFAKQLSTETEFVFTR